MARIITPLQTQISNAYKHKLFDFDPTDYKQYISNTISDLLKAVGQNVILDGITPTLSYTNTTVVSLFTPGQIIIDNVLIDITGSAELTYTDAHLKSTDGVFVAILNYKQLQTLENNPAIFSFYYLSSDNILDPTLDSARTGILLGIFDFTVENSIVTSFTTSTEYKTTFNSVEHYVGGYRAGNMNFTKLFGSITDFQSMISYLRSGDATINYDSDDNVIGMTIQTPYGNIIIGYNYNIDDQITTETLSFRDVLLNTKTYTYASGDLISWTEN